MKSREVASSDLQITHPHDIMEIYILIPAKKCSRMVNLQSVPMASASFEYDGRSRDISSGVWLLCCKVICLFVNG